MTCSDMKDAVLAQPIDADERLGLPSASGMARIIRCPASLVLARRLHRDGETIPDSATPDAHRGTRIHRALQALAEGDAEWEGYCEAPDEAADANALWERAERLMLRVFGDVDTDRLARRVEERMWYIRDGEKLFSGRFDLVVLAEGMALVIDYKTGRGVVDAADGNAQLGAAAVLLEQNYGVSKVVAAILQTGCKDSVVDLPAERIDGWRSLIVDALEVGDDPFAAGFCPSEATCKYCKVRGCCPAIAYQLTQVGDKLPTDFVGSLTATQLGDYLTKFRTLRLVEKEVEAEAERRLREGLPVEGWMLACGPTRRSVVRPAELAQRLVGAGVPLTDVLGAVKLSVGDCEKLHAAATGMKGRMAAAEFANLADGTVEAITPKPSLKAI